MKLELDSQPDLTLESHCMRLFSRALWIIAFLAATFSWMVLFQYGFSWQAFSSGAQTELQSLTALAGMTKAP
jgi:hypothetical protein